MAPRDSICSLTAGATIGNAADAFGAELVLKVVAPDDNELALINSGAVLIGMLNPFSNETIAELAERGITAFSLEAAPRTSRAQSLDVLSSQANIAGYKAVLVAAQHYPRFMPMLMTAAGTVKAALAVFGAAYAGPVCGAADRAADHPQPDHCTLLAIPFFLLSGAFMTSGGVARRLINFANACTRPWGH